MDIDECAADRAEISGRCVGKTCIYIGVGVVCHGNFVVCKTPTGLSHVCKRMGAGIPCALRGSGIGKFHGFPNNIHAVNRGRGRALLVCDIYIVGIASVSVGYVGGSIGGVIVRTGCIVRGKGELTIDAVFVGRCFDKEFAACKISD